MRHLSLLGHLVDAASNGIEALGAMDKKRYDIVVTDVQMPGMDGHELLIRLRKDQPLIRAIVMTGFVNMESIMSYLREGAFSFVTKPPTDVSIVEATVRPVHSLEGT